MIVAESELGNWPSIPAALARVGFFDVTFDLRAQAKVTNARRSDTPTHVSVQCEPPSSVSVQWSWDRPVT